MAGTWLDGQKVKGSSEVRGRRTTKGRKGRAADGCRRVLQGGRGAGERA